MLVFSLWISPNAMSEKRRSCLDNLVKNFGEVKIFNTDESLAAIRSILPGFKCDKAQIIADFARLAICWHNADHLYIDTDIEIFDLDAFTSCINENIVALGYNERPEAENQASSCIVYAGGKSPLRSRFLDIMNSSNNSPEYLHYPIGWNFVLRKIDDRYPVKNVDYTIVDKGYTHHKFGMLNSWKNE
jgi:hypothetical protein